MGNERLMRKQLARDNFNQSLGRVSLSMTMNLFVEPTFERLEVTTSKLLLQTSQFALRGGEKLSRIHIAQRVSWKISQQPRTPMDVLQTAVRIRWNRQTGALIVEMERKLKSLME